jgi:NAD(P)-dependent dehydrogenase (short-subunit alcohol dehydrogenase family)
MKRLEGKVILVAGSGGIGAELARRYASDGAKVVLGDIDTVSAKAVVGTISDAGGQASAVHLDGADEQSIASAVLACVETYGALDGLHANFASFADNGDDVGVLDLPLEAFDETMCTNMRGFYLCTRQALPPIIARGGGAILYTSSAAAYLAEPTRVAYAMAKEACHALMRHVAARHGRDGVRANCIAPGIIMHERWGTKVSPELVKWAVESACIKSRVGRPGDIAAMSALLMSDEGSFITGQIISVDGGITLRP